MTTVDTKSTLKQLRQRREELFPQPRTVTHWLLLATDKQQLSEPPPHQHLRCVPSTWGTRRDAFCWDSWDWSVRGEQDLRNFFKIARKIAQELHHCHCPELQALLPGSMQDCLGTATQLYWADYWLLVVHHLGWSELLPYDCELQWQTGTSFDDEPFRVRSHLPVNIVQASIDALTVLIDAIAGDECGRAAETTSQSMEKLGAVDQLDQSTPQRDQRSGKNASWSRERRPPRKRADRAANIEALKRALVAHIHAARDHAQAAIDFGRQPELLPRPSRRDLARQVGINESAVSRCFSDPSATELNLLWRTSDNLDAILQFVRA